MAQLAAAFATDMNPRLQPRSSEHHSHTSLARLHQASPVPRPDNGVERDVSASSSVARNAQTSREEVRKQLEAALTTCVPQYRIPAKEVAANIQQSTGKVASIRRKVPEGMIDAALICIHYPDFAKAWARVAQMQADLHPESARALNEFIQTIVRRA